MAQALFAGKTITIIIKLSLKYSFYNKKICRFYSGRFFVVKDPLIFPSLRKRLLFCDIPQFGIGIDSIKCIIC